MLSSIAKRAGWAVFGAVVVVLLAWGYLTYLQLTTSAAQAAAVWEYMAATPQGADAPRSKLLDQMLSERYQLEETQP